MNEKIYEFKVWYKNYCPKCGSSLYNNKYSEKEDLLTTRCANCWFKGKMYCKEGGGNPPKTSWWRRILQ